MPFDSEGYGFPAQDRTIGRLAGDIRELGREGVERVAQGWDRHVGEVHLEEFRAAEQAAQAALERQQRTEEWDQVQSMLFGLTEGRSALASWKAEHGNVGGKAERAALAAALGLLAGPELGRHHLNVLLQPMAEALPWLLLDDDTNLSPDPAS